MNAPTSEASEALRSALLSIEDVGRVAVLMPKDLVNDDPTITDVDRRLSNNCKRRCRQHGKS